MQEPLLSGNRPLRKQSWSSSTNSEENVSFRQCIEEVGRNGRYQRNLFILMTIFWVSASFFLSFPFYLFEKPHYFLDSPDNPCNEYDTECQLQVCERFYPEQIGRHVKNEVNLTHKFEMYCSKQWQRIVYKSLVSTAAFVGLLVFGWVSDFKGRQAAMKISWRFYTFGVLMFSATQTQFLITFGYVIACVSCYASLITQFIIMFEAANESRRLQSFLLILSSSFIGSVVSAVFASDLFELISVRWALLFACGAPALILCFFLNYIEESPKFLFKNDKVKAFNAINRIAKKNLKPMVLIDLGQSEWVKFEKYQIGYTRMLSIPEMRVKLLVLGFLILCCFMSSRCAQVSLDPFTNSYARGLIISGSTGLAYLFLMFSKLRIPLERILVLGVFLNALNLALVLGEPQQREEWFKICQIVVLTFISFFSELPYAYLLILSIELCPTVVRGQSIGILLSTMSITSIFVRALQVNRLVYAITNIALGAVLVAVLASKLLKLEKTGKVIDTIKGRYYDDNDKFLRIKAK